MTSPTYVVMGARGGAGEATARALAARDMPLFLTGRTEAGIAPLAQSLGARWAVCDALDPPSIEAALAQADSGSGLGGLAYCIGSIVLKPLKAARSQDFIDAFSLNVVGAAMAVRAAQAGLAKADGAVVLFSTVAVGQGFPNHAVIAAAKGGIEGLTRALAAELAPKIRVNAIAPSLTETEMAAPLLANAQMAQTLAGLHPLQRLGTAADLGAAAAFLLGPEAGWITGQVIGVDGGRGALKGKS